LQNALKQVFLGLQLSITVRGTVPLLES
jgi:hypothetical protein